MGLRAIDEDGGEISEDDAEEVDKEELAGFAEHLGLSLPAEQDLMWICKMALNAPVPAGWTPHNDGEGNTYYYHAETGASSWDHPSDPYFRTLLRRCRRLKVSAGKGLQSSQAAVKANEDLNAQLDSLKGKYNELKAVAAKVGQENDAMSQRCSTLEEEMINLRQGHGAEIEGLKKVHVDLRGKAFDLESLQKENSELKAAADAAAAELQRYRSGEAVDLKSRVAELEQVCMVDHSTTRRYPCRLVLS